MANVGIMQQMRTLSPFSLPFPIHYLLPADTSLVCWGRLIKSVIEQLKTYAACEINETLKRNEAIFSSTISLRNHSNYMCLPATTTVLVKA
jgi:hypothetical protein